MQPVVDSIHELFVRVETLGSQPDLHLGEEMVIAWRQFQTVRRVVKNIPVEELDWSICASRDVGPHVVVQENDAFSEHPAPSFWIDLRSLFGVSLVTLSHYHIIPVHTTPPTTNLGRTLFFCVKKTNHSTYPTAGGSGDDSVCSCFISNYSYTKQRKCMRVGVQW